MHTIYAHYTLVFYHVWNDYNTGHFLQNEKHWMWNCLGTWQSWLDKMCTWKKIAFIVFHQVRTCFYKHTKALKLTLHVQIHNGNQNLSLLQHSLCSAFEPLCADLANAGEHILLVTCMTWTCTRSRTHYVVPETHAYKFSSAIQKTTYQQILRIYDYELELLNSFELTLPSMAIGGWYSSVCQTPKRDRSLTFFCSDIILALRERLEKPSTIWQTAA